MEKKDIYAVIRKFNMFSLNFDSSLKWIHDIFDPVGLGDHLEGKFRMYHESIGSDGVMLIFWASLDSDNQERLIDWIMDNYKG